MQSKCHLHLATIHTALQLAQSTQAANELNTLVGTQVLDAQYLIQNQARRDVNIQHSNRIAIIVSAWLSIQAIPLAIEIKEEAMQDGWLQDIETALLNGIIQ